MRIKMLMMTGTPSLSQSGAFAVTGPVWRPQAEKPVAVARPRITGLTGGLVYQARLRTLVNPIGIDLPVIDRMRASVTEP